VDVLSSLKAVAIRLMRHLLQARSKSGIEHSPSYLAEVTTLKPDPPLGLGIKVERGARTWEAKVLN